MEVRKRSDAGEIPPGYPVGDSANGIGKSHSGVPERAGKEGYGRPDRAGE